MCVYIYIYIYIYIYPQGISVACSNGSSLLRWRLSKDCRVPSGFYFHSEFQWHVPIDLHFFGGSFQRIVASPLDFIFTANSSGMFQWIFTSSVAVFKGLSRPLRISTANFSGRFQRIFTSAGSGVQLASANRNMFFRAPLLRPPSL